MVIPMSVRFVIDGDETVGPILDRLADCTLHLHPGVAVGRI
jgi:hypothetical protein